MRSILTAVAVPALICLASGSASAQEAAAPFTLDCPDDKSCIAGATLRSPDRDGVFASIRFIAERGNDDILMTITTPLGVALPPGVKLVAGDTVELAQFFVCYPDGCATRDSLSAEAFEALAAAETVDIQYFPANAEAPIGARLPVAGLADSIADARERLAE